MKKILALGLLAVVLFCCSTMHTIDGVLLEINNDDGIVWAYYATEDGNGWVAEHDPALEVGQSCRIYFYDNLTPNNIYDDIMIGVNPYEN
jgi:hypothetical protein